MFGDIRPARAARGQVWLPVRLHLLCRPGSPGPVPARGRRCLPRVCTARVLALHGLAVELCSIWGLRTVTSALTGPRAAPFLASGSGQPGVH